MDQKLSSDEMLGMSLRALWHLVEVAGGTMRFTASDMTDLRGSVHVQKEEDGTVVITLVPKRDS